MALVALACLGTGSESLAQSSDIESKALSRGAIVPERAVTLAANIAQRIVSVEVDEGQKVTRGDVLVTIDDAALQADLARAQASVTLMQVELEHARRTEQRLSRLSASNTISKEMLDDARYERGAAQARLRIEEAQEAKVRALLQETQLVAPFDAVVVAKRAEVGQLTQPGEPLLMLEDHRELRYRARVKAKDLSHIEQGQPVTVIVDALKDERLQGEIVKIVPSGDDAHTFVVEARVGAARGLYPGMFAKAAFAP